MYSYISCISSLMAHPLFSQQYLQSRHGETLHLYASTILYSPPILPVIFPIRPAVSPFILGEPFNIKVFVIPFLQYFFVHTIGDIIGFAVGTRYEAAAMHIKARLSGFQPPMPDSAS